MTTRTDMHDLAGEVSQWSQREMNFKISPSTVVKLLNYSDMFNVWKHIIKEVKNTTPLNSILTKIKKISEPPSPELVSHHKRITQEENELDLEIANLERNLEVELGIMEKNDERINNLNVEVYMQPSKIELMNAYRFLLSRHRQVNEDFINEAESALSELPPSGKTDWNNSQLSTDVQEALKMLRVYYQTARNPNNASEEIFKVHKKLRQMIKLYGSEDYLELLSDNVDTQKLRRKEEYSDLRMIQREMDNCLSELQAAHKDSFISVQIINNRIKDLESLKAALMNHFKQQVTLSSELSEIENMYGICMKNILDMEMTKLMLEPEVPDEMPCLSIKDLEEVQHRIEVNEEVFMNVNLQIAKVRHANQSMLSKICTTVKVDNPCDLDASADELGQLQVYLKSNEMCKNLDDANELLLQLKTHKPDLGDLCVRITSQMMNHSVKKELQKALDMPSYVGPELLAMYLQRKRDEFWDSCSIKRIQNLLLAKLDLEEVIPSCNNTLKSFEVSNLHAIEVTKKAVDLSDFVSSLLSDKELEECLQDFKEQPAFSDHVLSVV